MTMPERVTKDNLLPSLMAPSAYEKVVLILAERDALEFRLREVEEERELWRRAHIRAEEGIRALRADLAALTPLARLGLVVRDEWSNLDSGGAYLVNPFLAAIDVGVLAVDQPSLAWHDTPATTSARAILARGEGK